MKKLLKQSVEFYSILEYFTTKNEDDTNKLPTIPSKPFNETETLNIKVRDMINDKLFEGTKIKCVFIEKK
jgi:hypothetical protein